VPLVPAAVCGLRTWAVAGDRLAGPQTGTPWPVGGEWLIGECARGHAAPAHDCACGIHAWHPRLRSARRIVSVRGNVGGVVETSGAIEVHEDGLRAERARPFALVAMHGRNADLVHRLAAAYGVPVIEARRPQDILDRCRERGVGLEPDVVARLLGQDPEQLAQQRRRRARRLALRSAALVAAIAAMLALGVALTDDPGDRTLNGRTGPVHPHR
jgi:hypothetical protein